MRSVRPDWYYTYVLLGKTKGNLYTGATKNLIQRLKRHNDGLVLSSKKMRPLQLIYFEACLNKSDAYRREKYLPRLDFSNIWRLMKSINWLTVLNWESLTGFKSGMGKRYLRNRLSGGLTG